MLSDLWKQTAVYLRATVVSIHNLGFRRISAISVQRPKEGNASREAPGMKVGP
jgi:hypothetical protein